MSTDLIELDSSMIVKVQEAMAWLNNKVETLQKQNEEMTPKAEFYDAVTQTNDQIDMAQVSKVLGIKGYGRTNLFYLLRVKCKILLEYPKNEPYQKYVDSGHFKVIEYPFEDSTGQTRIYRKTVVTQKGIDLIRKKIKEDIECKKLC